MNGKAYESEVRKGAAEYLEDKYGVSFSISRVIPASNPFTGTAYDRIYVEGPDGRGEFLVKRHEEDGRYRFEDGYAYWLAADYLNPILKRLATELEPGCSMAARFSSPAETTLYEYSGRFDWDGFRVAEEGRSAALVDVVLPRLLDETHLEAAHLHALVRILDGAGVFTPWNVRIWYFEPNDEGPRASHLVDLESEQVRAEYGPVYSIVLWRDGPGDPEWSEERIAERLEGTVLE